MNKDSGFETTIRKQAHDGRAHFQLRSLLSDRLYELLLPVLWGVTVVVGLLAVIWVNSS